MTLKERLARRERIVGTFVKTPSPIVVEVLARTSLDCLVLDAEHAPFDRSAIDACVMAAALSARDVLVRVPSNAPEYILNALDCGATGVVIPHVRTAEDARAAVAASQYGRGGRGYAGSSRAAGYTRTPMAEHLRASAARTVVVLQIEDPEAIEVIDAIAAIDGVDALFVGRVDLAVALGATALDDLRVAGAVRTVCRAGAAHGRPTGMFLAHPREIAAWTGEGASLFLLGSDHAFLIGGADALATAAREAESGSQQ